MSDVIELTEAVTFEVRGHYAVITINRPEARNAVNGAVANGIEAGIDRIEEDDDLWVGIVTGVPPVFCAGADLKEINSGNAAAPPDQARRLRRHRRRGSGSSRSSPPSTGPPSPAAPRSPSPATSSWRRGRPPSASPR